MTATNMNTDVNADDDVVDLIPSGYEWTCPNCDDLNQQDAITHQVICKSCGKLFKTMIADPVFED